MNGNISRTRLLALTIGASIATSAALADHDSAWSEGWASGAVDGQDAAIEHFVSLERGNDAVPQGQRFSETRETPRRPSLAPSNDALRQLASTMNQAGPDYAVQRPDSADLDRIRDRDQDRIRDMDDADQPRQLVRDRDRDRESHDADDNGVRVRSTEQLEHRYGAGYETRSEPSDRPQRPERPDRPDRPERPVTAERPEQAPSGGFGRH